MNPHRHHVDAVCLLLEARLAAAPETTARRLLRPQFRWVEQELRAGAGEALAQRLGVVAFVESCRDEHLASLDADDGLAVLGIGWQEVVRRLGERDRERVSRGSRKCPRCGDRMVERRLRQTKRRHPPGEHFRRVAGSPEYRVYRCVACGLVQKP